MKACTFLRTVSALSFFLFIEPLCTGCRIKFDNAIQKAFAQPADTDNNRFSVSITYSDEIPGTAAIRENITDMLLADNPVGIGNLKYIQKVYPDLRVERSWDSSVKDWRLYMSISGRSAVLYWADGKLLPKTELEHKDDYEPVLYSYPHGYIDSDVFTEEENARIQEHYSRENRKESLGTNMSFFDLVYDSSSRAGIESHIKQITFLGHKSNVHERIYEPLVQVDKKIQTLAKTDPEVKTFLKEIKSADCYHWRIIEGTNRKSLHALGLAIDIMPTTQHGKHIFWSWTKDKLPDTWMIVPLKRRWTPPDAVIRIFEEEGFVWGGKWIIYDNMHFEYRPEVINYNFYPN